HESLKTLIPGKSRPIAHRGRDSFVEGHLLRTIFEVENGGIPDDSTFLHFSLSSASHRGTQQIQVLQQTPSLNDFSRVGSVHLRNLGCHNFGKRVLSEPS